MNASGRQRPRNVRTWLRAFLALAALVLSAFAIPAAHAANLTPRPAVEKPAHAVLQPWHRRDVVIVKFTDGLGVRLRAGELSDFGTHALDGVREIVAANEGATWTRAYAHVAEEKLDELRERAEQKLGRAIADFNTSYHLLLPDGADVVTVIESLNALDVVEIAAPAAQGPPAPVPGIMQHEQAYLNAGPAGLGAYGAWERFATSGANVKVGVIDYDWNASHLDLPSVTLVGPAPPAGFPEDHATAALGIVGSLDNGVGTTGMATGAQLYFAAAEAPAGTWDVSAAILNLLTVLSSGDVILIEQQWFGPNWSGVGQQGLVAVEWRPAEYNAILAAVGNGVTVVEPAGNGSENLSAAVYLVDDPSTPEVENHQPFANDSGAIMVGAGAAPQPHGGSDVNLSRLSSSNWGTRLSVQGWGEGVVSCGYGTWYGFDGTNYYYTNTFGGTSGASAMVAGACALVQSAHVAANGSPLTPAALRTLLVNTGEAQVAGTFPVSQKIGPRPDATMALASVLGRCVPLWDTGVGAQGLTGGIFTTRVNASIVFDDGGGDDLYVGGMFATAGSVTARRVARWDGSSWSAVGTQIVGSGVEALAVYDDGNGAALYAAGKASLFDPPNPATPNVVIRYDGTNWVPVLGIGQNLENPNVYALAVYDDGNGAKLYAAGTFTNAGGSSAANIAAWDGAQWSALGSGITHTTFPFPSVQAMCVWDDGNGAKLYVGGTFDQAGGTSANGVAKWDGSTWSAVGTASGGPDAAIAGFGIFDDGSGAALYAGGSFTNWFGGALQAYGVAKWNGSQWSALPGAQTSQYVTSFAVFDDGLGPALYIGGTFTDAGEVWAGSIVKWDGNDWWPLGDGIGGGSEVNALTVYDDGSAPALYPAGLFSALYDLPVNNIGRWDGCPPCPEDVDGNGTVGFNDLTQLLLAWGPCPAPPAACPADLDANGSVGFNDLTLLLLAWGPCP